MKKRYENSYTLIITYSRPIQQLYIELAQPIGIMLPTAGGIECLLLFLVHTIAECLHFMQGLLQRRATFRLVQDAGRRREHPIKTGQAGSNNPASIRKGQKS